MTDEQDPTGLRRSPLYGEHLELSAKLVDFGGWEMPLAYPKGTIAEHLSCRRQAAVFDVSHLGTVRITGPDAFERLQAGLSNDLSKIGPGRAQYTHLLNDAGGVLDDIIVWWIAEDRFEVMPNASNTSRVLDVLGGDDVTTERAILAVQGPKAREVVARVAPVAASVGRFRIVQFDWEAPGKKTVSCIAAGTGYTGEDGIECSVPSSAAPAFWRSVVESGALPAGLGARDTLRLEAGLPLHGHELGPEITPLDAGLDWVVGFSKDHFRGKAALERIRDTGGPARHLVGIVTEERRPPRAGDAIIDSSEGSKGPAVGIVTSGNYSPVLERGIALGFVPAAMKEGMPAAIDIRGKIVKGRLRRLPFIALPS